MLTATFSQYPKYGVNLSVHQWMNGKKNPPHTHTHRGGGRMEYYSGGKKKEIPSFATIWRYKQNIM